MLANLYNPPTTAEALQVFSFNNADEHRKIRFAIIVATTLVLPDLQLDPISPGNWEAWLYLHQQAHNNQNAVLGISGNDLSDVNLKDERALNGWLWLHGQEHYQANQLLRIT